MKIFTVEGANWVEDYQVDSTLFDNYEDMALEAMTLALEEFMSMPEDPPSSWHPDCKYASMRSRSGGPPTQHEVMKILFDWDGQH